MNLADLLTSSAQRHGRRAAVTDVRSGRSLSYAELASEAERVAAFLAAQSVAPGQRIALIAPNGLAYLPAAFGLLAAGACMVPLAGGITPGEISQTMTEIQVNGCLAWPNAAPLEDWASPTSMTGGACDGFTFRWIDRGAEAPSE